MTVDETFMKLKEKIFNAARMMDAKAAHGFLADARVLQATSPSDAEICAREVPTAVGLVCVLLSICLLISSRKTACSPHFPHMEALQAFRVLGDIHGETAAQTLIAQAREVQLGVRNCDVLLLSNVARFDTDTTLLRFWF